MCGRLILATPAAELARLFGFPDRAPLMPRYNLAPTQELPIVRTDSEGRRQMVMARWGLVPSWAKDISIGSRMINARAETVADKPAYRKAFRCRRCVVPADGFYEWQAVPGRRGKRPFAVRRRDRAPFAIAGLWETWAGPDASAAAAVTPLLTATVITTAANPLMAQFHDRMPVILAEPEIELWLSADADSAALQALLRPCPEGWLDLTPVSTRVNNARWDDPTCLAPEAQTETLL